MFSLGEPKEIKFLVNYYCRRAINRNLPLRAVQALLKPKKETSVKDVVKEESVARLEQLEHAKLDSSCNSDESQFVELEEKKSKKRSFKEWINGKKQRFCKAFHRLCCCFRNKTTVSWFRFPL